MFDRSTRKLKLTIPVLPSPLSPHTPPDGVGVSECANESESSTDKDGDGDSSSSTTATADTANITQETSSFAPPSTPLPPIALTAHQDALTLSVIVHACANQGSVRGEVVERSVGGVIVHSYTVTMETNPLSTPRVLHLQ